MLAISTFILTVSISACLLKLLTSRSDAGRVIAIDVLTFQLLGLSIVLAFHDQRPLALQFALALSLLGFLSTIVLSRLIRNP